MAEGDAADLDASKIMLRACDWLSAPARTPTALALVLALEEGLARGPPRVMIPTDAVADAGLAIERHDGSIAVAFARARRLCSASY
jgi:hypothetical protein